MLLKLYKQPSIVFNRGAGTRLFDTNGIGYLDFTAGIAVTSLGHSNKKVADAVSKQVNKLVHISNLYAGEESIRLSERLAKLADNIIAGGVGGVFLCNSGTEANEAAIKFARKVGHVISNDKKSIISFKDAFHGRSMGSLSATPAKKYQEPFRPLVPGFHNSEKTSDAVRELIERFQIDNELNAVAGIIVEPIQGEGGILELSEEFLINLRRICDEEKILLIFDEIQCGLGRTGYPFGFMSISQNYQKFLPDIVTLAKPLANGLPIGCVISGKAITKNVAPGDHGSTFGGNPVACAAANVVLDHILNESFLSEVQDKGSSLKKSLQNLNSKFPALIKEVRGSGLMIGVEFYKDIQWVVDNLLKMNVLVVSAGNGKVLRIVPPLTVSMEEIGEFLVKLEKVLEEGNTPLANQQ